MARVKRIKREPKHRRKVFNTNVSFTSTGCPPLDCILGGGYAMGRMCNIIGDRSSGKTLLAMEAFANFLQGRKGAECLYYEVESAWDEEYIRSLGVPTDAIDLIDDIDTAEDLADHFIAWLDDRITTGWDLPAMACVDSWDALSSKQEQDQKSFGDGTYGMGKSKLASAFFRNAVRKMEKAGVTLLIVSQVRDNINAGMFGKKTKRQGGRALDFYASQILWLAEKNKIRKTIKGVKRPIGIDVTCTTDKNKVGLPYRSCDVSIFFGYGVDDIAASVLYLKSVNAAMPKWISAKERDKLIKGTAHMDLDADYIQELRVELMPMVRRTFEETEQEFLPVRSKY